jgi:hypothetical protein
VKKWGNQADGAAIGLQKSLFAWTIGPVRKRRRFNSVWVKTATMPGQPMNLNRPNSLLLVTALLLVVAPATEAPARNYGQYRDTDPALRKWVEGLTDKNGKGCCETADGHPTEYEWDIAENRYRVRIEGEWYVVPVEAVIEGPNKLGYATVWYWSSWELDGNKTHHIRCFLPGPGG